VRVATPLVCGILHVARTQGMLVTYKPATTVGNR